MMLCWLGFYTVLAVLVYFGMKKAISACMLASMKASMKTSEMTREAMKWLEPASQRERSQYVLPFSSSWWPV